MAEFIKLLTRIIFKIFFRFEVEGIENIPTEGGVILCSNHPGTLDMFFIACKVKRLVHYMAKEELFRNPILRFIVVKLGAFPVKRGRNDMDSIKTAIRILKDGKILGILPEGTRTGPNNEKNIKPKPGVALIATKAKVPIVPAAITGGYKLFGKVKVVYGKPFYINGGEPKKYTKDDLIEITNDIMSKIYMLLEE